MKSDKLYRISFYNRGDIYELYARNIQQSDLYAFVEIEDILFGERSAIVVDPSEEKLKTEFSGVSRTHIPMQAVIRIDEVAREGASKIIPTDGATPNVAPFPVPRPHPRDNRD